jgi:hypothetical protein
MGVDEMAVVDRELRVRGIDGLRLADASVMPCQHQRHGRAHLPVLGCGGEDFTAQRALSSLTWNADRPVRVQNSLCLQTSP